MFDGAVVGGLLFNPVSDSLFPPRLRVDLGYLFPYPKHVVNLPRKINAEQTSKNVK